MTAWWFLRGVYPEPVEGLRMTLVASILAAYQKQSTGKQEGIKWTGIIS
jgi:hypothetical protein